MVVAWLRRFVPAVVDDVESVKAEAVSRLQAALVSGDGVRDAVRWAFYRNPAFMLALFPAALGRRFGSGPDAVEVTAFVSRAAPADNGEAAAVFPASEAELLIRMSLGELGLIGEIDKDLNHVEIAIAVLDRLFAEWPPGPVEVQELFGEAQAAADFAGDADPDVAQAVSSWFAGGMHASPFAYPLQWTGPGAFSERPDDAPLDLRRLEEEVTGCSRVLDSHPESGWALCRRARAFQLLGRLEEALADCARALRRDPAAAWALCRRGEIYDALGRHEEALAAFSGGADLRPSAAWAIGGRARALQHLGRVTRRPRNMAGRSP
jgi:tetratricopeptide (TPR) repeat protein